MHLRARFSIIFVAMAALAFASAVKADPIYTSSTAFSSATYGVSSVGFSSPGYGAYTGAGPSYTVGAVNFSSSSNLNLDDAAYYTVHGGAPANPSNYLIVFGNTPTDTVTITFPSSTAFSIDLGGTFNTGEAITVTLSDGFTYSYNASGYVTSGSGLDFLGFTSTTPLTWATITFADTPDYGTISGVEYCSATPEPGSLLLLGSGMLGLGLLVYRKKLFI